MVGIVEVVPGIPRVLRAFRRIVDRLKARRPALAILIDFPDFNLRLAKKLKREGVQVIYFVAPQVWAWRRGRLSALRQYVDRLLCIFPFEEKFFLQAGVQAEFVGHPLIGRVAPRLNAAEFRRLLQIQDDRRLIALLPGSRQKEIALNLPPMLEASKRLPNERKLGFVIAAATPGAAQFIRGQISKLGQHFVVVENHTYDAVAHAAAAMVASGTATVETALLGTPMVVVYRVTRATWFLGRGLVHTPFYSMVNLVMGRQIVPEFIQDQFQPDAVAASLEGLVEDSPARRQMLADLAEMAQKLTSPSTAELDEWLRLPRESAAQAGTTAGSRMPLRPAGDVLDPIERSVVVTESILRARLSPQESA